MNTDPKRPIGFRRSNPFGPLRIGWRFWLGPLLVARTPGIRPGIVVSWTR